MLTNQQLKDNARKAYEAGRLGHCCQMQDQDGNVCAIGASLSQPQLAALAAISCLGTNVLHLPHILDVTFEDIRFAHYLQVLHDLWATSRAEFDENLFLKEILS